jgi:methyl-accepting chemotaxis protein
MLKHLTIRTRLAIGFASLAGIVVLVSGLSLRALSIGNDRFTLFSDGINARAQMADRVRTAVDRRAIAARNLVLVDKPEDVALEKGLVTQAHEDVRTSLATLKQMVAAPDASDKERVLVGEMDRIERAYAPVALGIVKLALEGRKAEAIVKMNDECRPLLAALSRASADYSEYAKARSREMTSEVQSRFGRQLAFLVSVSAIAVALATLAGLMVTRSITGPLRQAVRLTEAVAAGDLSVQVDIGGRDEVSQLLEALGRMTRSLGRIVTQVRQGSDSIATGSTEIAIGNSDLSRRTEMQASALEETAATMEELNSTVRNNAENAMQASQLAKGASGVASEGGDIVAEVVRTMRGINESSRKIADIIAVIDGIAFQTNILALNAAVEAARAGDQGRGFAVVASEVRGLAQRSASAAKEIKALITDSVEQVDRGTTQVDRAGAKMQEIVGAIKRVSDIMSEISAASVEQSSGVAQVGEAVTQMDQATQQNAALVEQSAAAAESLKQQARHLVDAVAVFKLDQAARPPVDEWRDVGPATEVAAGLVRMETSST